MRGANVGLRVPAVRTTAFMEFRMRSTRLFLFASAAAALASAPVFAGAVSGCTCTGDLNLDGQVNGADLGALIGVWGTASSVADLDGNGLVNGGDLGILIGNWGVCVPPENDTCANAMTVLPGFYDFCTGLAGTEGPSIPQGTCGPANPSMIYHDVWYQYEALSDGKLTVSTCGLTSLDTVIAVYGSALPNFAPCPTEGPGLAIYLGCSDDFPGCSTQYASSVTIDTLAGHFYKIRLGSFFDEGGSGTLQVDFVSEGSDCTNPILIPSNQTTFDVIGNTEDNPVTDLPPCVPSPANAGPGEWIRWQSNCSGTVVAYTCDPATDYDTILTVLRYDFQGNCWDVILACNDDWTEADACLLNGQYRKSRVSFQASPGAVYYFLVSGWNGAAGNYKLTVINNCF